uniref:Sororin C-terminal region domain-containing protein n=1 Tax=Oryza punctata TaxID=4537 RepID=A0A0E0JUD1_ORYPU
MSAATGAADGMRSRRRRRLPLADLTNLSSTSASSLTRLKARAQSKSCTTTSNTGSSTVPRSRCPPPLPLPLPPHGDGIEGKDKSTRELQSSAKMIKKNSKPAVRIRDMLPGASPPPSIKTGKRTKEQQHRESLDHNIGNSLASQNFIEKQRAYFAEIDAFELVEEFVSGSDLE